MDRIFKPPFSMTGAISQDRQSCQFLFLLDEKPTVVPVGAAGEGSKCARTGSLWSRSLELRASGFVGLRGKRYSAPQIVWNKSTRRAGERGGARDGRPRWLRILSITGGSSIAAIIFKAPPQLGQCSISPCRHRAC